MIFQNVMFLDFMRGIHAAFKALFKILMPVILSPPEFLLSIIVDVFSSISPINLKIIELISLISGSGITKTVSNSNVKLPFFSAQNLS